MLIEELPRDSATRRAAIGEAEDWGVTEHLLATLIDAVQAWGWAQLGTKKGRPDPIRRPGAATSTSPSNRTALTGKEIAARLRQLGR